MSKNKKIVPVMDKGYYITVNHVIGDKIKFKLSDDNRIHTGKIIKIFIRIVGESGMDTEYEVETRFRGRKDYAMVKPEEIVE